MSVLCSISQGEDLLIHVLEGVLVHDSVWTLLFESTIETADFTCRYNIELIFNNISLG